MNTFHFLVVDDSSTSRNMIETIIKSSFNGAVVHKAANGSEAYDILLRAEIDIVISDWDMPLMSGEDLLYKIRNESNNKDVLFIMVTSHSERDYFITAIQNRVSQYIVKPFTPEELEQKILLCLNSDSKRQNKRFSNIPRHSVIIKFSNLNIQATLLDISQSGAFLELDYQDEITLFKGCTITISLKLPNVSALMIIGPIKAMVVRLQAFDSFHPSSRKCNMALYFSAIHTDKVVQDKLSKLIKWLHSRLPEAVHDQAKPSKVASLGTD